MTLNPTPLPKGFLASGIGCGVRRYRPDFGVVVSECDATTVGVFTQNELAAAPIHYSKALLPSTRIRCIVTNSGQANAATGEQGTANNLKLCQAIADQAEIALEQVVVASTGVIGAQLDMEKLLPAVPMLFERVTDSADGFALAILTTDLVPKTVSAEVALSKGTVRITGISKGSGMIHPNMATMLGYLLTDASLSVPLAQLLLRESVDDSFNMISVDSDTSTNDCVFMMANGAAKVAVESAADIEVFARALKEVSIHLAQSIAADGEGASKLIEVRVTNAPSRDLARRAARCVTTSPLVKCAVHGQDPNWGRILAKMGAENVPSAILGKLDLRMQTVTIYRDGEPILFDRSDVKNRLKTAQVLIEVDFKSGSHAATAWGCDLSKKYVDINAEYTT